MRARVTVEMVLEFSIIPFEESVQEFEKRVKRTVECMIAKETQSIQCKIDYTKTNLDRKLEMIVNSPLKEDFCKYLEEHPNSKIETAINDFINQ